MKHQLGQQLCPDYWMEHQGLQPVCTEMPAALWPHCNHMCPSSLALQHPATQTLLYYANRGCPVNTSKAWMVEQMHAAMNRGPYKSTLAMDAIDQLVAEVHEKVKLGQAWIVDWNDIKHNPPTQLKISPISMIPHKSPKYRTILDLSFSIFLEDGSWVPSVNEASVKTAPCGAIDQIGHALSCIIHLFATTSPNEKVFMSKWDIRIVSGVAGLQGRGRMEFFLCAPVPRWAKHEASDPKLTPNGMDRISTVFLRSHQNGTGCSGTIYRDTHWISP